MLIWWRWMKIYSIKGEGAVNFLLISCTLKLFVLIHFLHSSTRKLIVNFFLISCPFLVFWRSLSSFTFYIRQKEKKSTSKFQTQLYKQNFKSDDPVQQQRPLERQLFYNGDLDIKGNLAGREISCASRSYLVYNESPLLFTLYFSVCYFSCVCFFFFYGFLSILCMFFFLFLFRFVYEFLAILLIISFICVSFY